MCRCSCHQTSAKGTTRDSARRVSWEVFAELISALWPLFHYLLWLDSTATVPAPDPSWIAYSRTNLMFAAKVAEIYRPGDLIIVHDYHLLLAPKMIREALGQISVPGGGWSASVTPSPALHNEKRRFDFDGPAESKGAKERMGNLLGHVGTALGHHLGMGEDRKEPTEIMIGMFVHTPWPSSEIFRCLPSK